MPRWSSTQVILMCQALPIPNLWYFQLFYFSEPCYGLASSWFSLLMSQIFFIRTQSFNFSASLNSQLSVTRGSYKLQLSLVIVSCSCHLLLTVTYVQNSCQLHSEGTSLSAISRAQPSFQNRRLLDPILYRGAQA